MHFINLIFFVLFYQHQVKCSNPIQSNPRDLISLSRCYIVRGQITMNYTKRIFIFITMHIFHKKAPKYAYSLGFHFLIFGHHTEISGLIPMSSYVVFLNNVELD